MSDVSDNEQPESTDSKVVVRLDTGLDVEGSPTLRELRKRGKAAARLAWLGRGSLQFLADENFVEKQALVIKDGRYLIEFVLPAAAQRDLFIERQVALQAANESQSHRTRRHRDAGSHPLESEHDAVAEGLRLVQDVVDEVADHLSSPTDPRPAIQIMEKRRGVKASPVLQFLYQPADELRFEVDDEQILITRPTVRAAGSYDDVVNLSVRLTPALITDVVYEVVVTKCTDPSRWPSSKRKDHLKFVGLHDWQRAMLLLCRSIGHEFSLGARQTINLQTQRSGPADVVVEPDWSELGEVAMTVLARCIAMLRKMPATTPSSEDLEESVARSAR